MEVDDALEGVKVQLGVMTELNRRAQPAMDRLEQQIEEFEPKVQLLDTTEERIDSIDVLRRNLEAQFDTVSKSVGSLTELGVRLETLATQVKNLSDVVATAVPAVAPTAGADAPSAEEIKTEAASIAQQTREVNEAVQKYGSRTTVFLQFGGMPREMAQSIAASLRDHGYNVPGEDQERMPQSGLFEIRYYFQGDRTAAETLSDTVTAVLDARHISHPQIGVKDMTNWPKTKPKPGTVELWLGLPAAAAD